MRKVSESMAKKKAFEGVFLLINEAYPSSSNKMMERCINPNSRKAPTKSSTADLKELGEMISKVLLACGVPDDLLIKYKKNCTEFQGRHHTFLVGMCDCTAGGLPPGTVFLTGFGVGSVHRKVFITRSPCTEPQDAKVIPIVSEKPTDMLQEDWNHLCSLPFGAVVFSSPQDDKAMSLVESINNSDLDGDLFFCLWDPCMLPFLEDAVGGLSVAHEKDILAEDKKN
uniref:RNA-dependent RNA polymerase n=1 Tax=Ditylum brightwellii TaxID=49249 RepID=A0A7S4VFE2_9STRA